MVLIILLMIEVVLAREATFFFSSCEIVFFLNHYDLYSDEWGYLAWTVVSFCYCGFIIFILLGNLMWRLTCKGSSVHLV